MKSVVVVILSWNKKQAVISCIERVKSLTGADLQVVVVDNASTDDSIEAIRLAHPDVTLLASTANEGFAGGVNRGLAEAARRGADFAWLLNDDTTFDAKVLGTLLSAVEGQRVGLWSPLLLDLGIEAGVQFRNGLIDWDAGAMFHNLARARFDERVAAGATSIVPGTALLCDLRVHRAIGPFDPRYFAYWEDVDYGIRAARAGFMSRVIDGAPLHHASTPTRNDRPPHYHYYMVRNEALFWQLHARGTSVALWRRRWLAESLEWLAQNRDLGRIENADACIDGLWHAWTRRYGPRSAHRPAPRWIRRLLLSRPYLLRELVRGNYGVMTKLFRAG